MAIYTKELKELNDLIGTYYNDEAPYYEVLRKICDFPNVNIWNIDTAIDTLRKGNEAVRGGKEIAYDGLNFIIKEN